MSDAPEKIWAWREITDDTVEKFWISNRYKVDGFETPYVREDVALAMVAAAYEDAGKAAFKLRRAGQAGYRDENERLIQRAENEMRLDVQKAIRALIHDDASAALEAREREAWNAAIEAAANEVTWNPDAVADILALRKE